MPRRTVESRTDDAESAERSESPMRTLKCNQLQTRSHPSRDALTMNRDASATHHWSDCTMRNIRAH
jgi:hypothetical protein